MTFAQKVIEGDNNSGTKRHRFVEIVIKGIPNFCKKFGIESGENISYRLCASQKEVIENGNKQILPYIPK